MNTCFYWGNQIKWLLSGALRLRPVPFIYLESHMNRRRFLLVVSQHHCPFCQKLESEILDPVMLSGQYTDKIIIVELLMDDEGDICSSHLTRQIIR